MFPGLMLTPVSLQTDEDFTIFNVQTFTSYTGSSLTLLLSELLLHCLPIELPIIIIIISHFIDETLYIIPNTIIEAQLNCFAIPWY